MTLILQVEELTNISVPADMRREESWNRTLKILLTDGAISLPGLEVRKIKELSINTPAGTKVLCQDFDVRRGVAIFGPENLKVIGGMVPDLELSRLENIERAECAKKRRQLVPVMAPPVADAGNDIEPQNLRQNPAAVSAEPSANPEPVNGQPHPSAGDDEYCPARDASQSSRSRPPSALPISATGGVRSRMQQPPVAPVLTSSPLPIHPDRPSLPPAQPPVSASVPIPVDDQEVVIVDVEPLAQAPPTARPTAAEPRQLAYLFQLLSRPSGRRPAGPQWVRAVAMGVVEFRCDPGAGGYLMRLRIADGTGAAVVRLGDAAVTELIGMPSAEYARRDKRETRPVRNAMSARLIRLQGLFLLAPVGGGGGGGIELEVLRIDESGGGGAARGLLQRVEAALETGMGPMEGPGW